MIRIYAPLFYFKSVRWVLRTWHHLVNGFEYIGNNRRDKVLIFRCTHWDPDTKLCDSYSSRPGMCRDYPRNLIYTCDPVFLESCGYYAVSKNAEKMREALKELNLPPDKLAALQAKLHVRTASQAFEHKTG